MREKEQESSEGGASTRNRPKKRTTPKAAVLRSVVTDQWLFRSIGGWDVDGLLLDIINNAYAARLPSKTYADAAGITPVSITNLIPPTVRSATPEPVFCTVDTSRVPEDHIGDTTPV
ncbi:hypothetical protein EDB81DRAFT_825951, partial [Dactylonectria macrodidyma]